MKNTKTLGTLLSLTLIVSILACLAALAVPVQAATGTLGNTTTGSTSYPGPTQEIGDMSSNSATSTGLIRCNQIVPTTNGTLVSIGLNVGLATGNLQVGIYADNGSNGPGALLGYSATAVAVLGWNDFTLNNQVNVTAGTTYWLGFQIDTSGLQTYRLASTGNCIYMSSTMGTFPDTFVQSGVISVTHNWRITYPSSGSLQNNTIAMQATLSGAIVTPTTMSFYSSAAGPLRLALYNDSSGMPGALLWQSASVNANATAWNNVTVTGVTNLQPGVYWLAFQWNSNSSGPNYIAGTAGSGNKVSQAYGSFPATWPNTGTNSSDQWSLFLTYNIVSIVTPTPSPTPSPTPVPTPTPNATATPTANPNATATPTVNPNATATPTGTGTTATPTTSGTGTGTDMTLIAVVVVVVVIVVVLVAVLLMKRKKP